MTSTLVPPAHGHLEADALRDLASALPGRVITQEDPAWEEARLAWLLLVDQRPAALVHCEDEHDVVTAVRWAARHDWPVTAQPRGHAGRTTLDGTVMLRTGGLKTLEVDVERRVARVGAGVKMGELMAALDGTGLVALSGSNPDPSVVGLCLGGGVSWFTRKYGFGANSVLAFDVVDAHGQLRHVSAETDPELFWALRGGGGDFGIVVAVEVSLKPEPQLYGGRLYWDLADAAAVFRAFRDLSERAPREMTLWAHLYHFPDDPIMPAWQRGRSFVSVAAIHLGPPDEAEALLAGLRAAGPVVHDVMRPLQPSDVGGVAEEPTEPLPMLEEGTLLDALDDAAIDGLVEAFADPAHCPLLLVELRQLGGAFAERPADGGAVSPVDAAYSMLALGMVVPGLEAEAVFAAFDRVAEPVARLATSRRLPNLTGEHQGNAAGYDGEALARLRTLKQERDPEGRFRSNKPVLGD